MHATQLYQSLRFPVVQPNAEQREARMYFLMLFNSDRCARLTVPIFIIPKVKSPLSRHVCDFLLFLHMQYNL